MKKRRRAKGIRTSKNIQERHAMKNLCFALCFSVTLLLAARVPAGERRVSRLTRRDGVAVTVPPPNGDFRRIDERNGAGFLGRVGGVPARAEAVVSEGAVPYPEFSRLKTRLLGFEDNAGPRRGPPGQRDEVRKISETAIFLCTLSEPRRERRHSGGGRRAPVVCSSRLYLYSSIVTLSLEADGADENDLIRAALEWTKAVLEANTLGIDEKPIISLQDPAAGRQPFILPLPEGLERLFDIGTRPDLPIFAFYRLDEPDPALAVDAAIFSLISPDPVPPGMFKSISDRQDGIFLKYPESRVVRRDGESVLYAYASEDRRWEGFTLVRTVRGLLVKFDMTCPYHDRRRARLTEEAILKWADEVRRENRPGPGGGRPARAPPPRPNRR
ncbi:MAG: hypothetical protein LBU64_02070 [Planctomycetota bacterium]|jgi:hypothetical protein|nr:hypothetical protein [Planctomycetota bacterium]